MLELVPGSLVAVVDTLNRYEYPQAGPSLLDRQIDGLNDSTENRLEDLIDRACSEAELSAQEWDEMTTLISVIPDLVLIPKALWAKITQRLLLETIVSSGFAWLPRYESFNRLMGHPRAQHAAIAACAALADDRTNLIFVEPVCSLDSSRHPDAGRHVLKQLHHPTNDQAFYGALLACVRKTKFGHFTADQTGELLSILRGTLQDERVKHEDVRPVAVHLLKQVPEDVGRPFAETLARAAQRDRAVQDIVKSGRLAEQHQAKIFIGRVLDHVAACLPRETDGYRDELLPSLVNDLIFHPILDIRLNAGLLISATPYAPLLASALALQISDARTAYADVRLSRSVLGALRTFGTARERTLVERFVLSAAHPGVAEAATFAIGHIGGGSDQRFWLRAITRYAALYDRSPTPTNLRCLTNIVYALGIARSNDLLRGLQDGHRSAAVRSAASWWLNLPRPIYEGVFGHPDPRG